LKIDLDGRKILSNEDFHRALAEVMDFGPYYGKNLNALWDRLTRDIERPIRLTWNYASVSRAALGDEDFRQIIDLLCDVEREDRELGYAEKFEFFMVD